MPSRITPDSDPIDDLHVIAESLRSIARTQMPTRLLRPVGDLLSSVADHLDAVIAKLAATMDANRP